MLLKPEFLVVQVPEDIAIENKEKKLLNNIRSRNWLGGQKELIKLLYFLEWFENKDLLLFCSEIYVLSTVYFHRRIISLHCDLKIAGYHNRWKILELVS